jgi:3-oxoacyl-[acyl-carrier-protein] synthase-1
MSAQQTPLRIVSFTAASCIGHGLRATLEALRARTCGLAPCTFEGIRIDTCTGEVTGVDAERLPQRLQEFDCRNNRLAQLGLRQDGFAQAVAASAGRWGRRRVGVFLGTSTSGILQTELAYRRLDPLTGRLPEDFHYAHTHNSFSVADFARRALALEGPAVVVC